MSIGRVAMVSVHTSPLAQPGTGDGGGMNVYVRSIASALVRAGVACDLLTRAEHPEQPPVVELEPGLRVVHLEAGPRAPVAKLDLVHLVDDLVDSARRFLSSTGNASDVLHANYWLSGAVAHRLKHDLGLPLVVTFHTLGHTKAQVGIADDPAERLRIEAEVVRCADAVVAATDVEAAELTTAYDAHPDRIEVIPPGVDHTIFTPGPGADARRHLGLGPEPVLVFVGRIQPLKGGDLAVRALAEVGDPRARLVVVGGPSGADGAAELTRLIALAGELGLADRVRFEPPCPHVRLPDYYRAADVVLVPSLTESFGLVALEAAACGAPVIASAVGGLRTVVADGETGYLLSTRTPGDWAARIDALLADPVRARQMGSNAVSRAARFTWNMSAARLRRLYADVPARELVQCT